METQEYRFTAWCGDTSWTVWLSWGWGTGPGTSLHIYFKRPDGWYYQGCIFKRNGQWVGPEKFTTDDVQILGEIIDINFIFPADS